MAPPSPLGVVFPSGQVLHGQSWLLVDGAILDVKDFSHRHPGGARLILNAVGTDVTHELLGEELSVGHAMAFSPHMHPEVSRPVGFVGCRTRKFFLVNLLSVCALLFLWVVVVVVVVVMALLLVVAILLLLSRASRGTPWHC